MDRRRVVHARPDALGGQGPAQRVAPRRLHRVTVVDVADVRPGRGRRDAGGGQRPIVGGGDAAAGLRPRGQMTELDPQDGALQGLHPAVEPGVRRRAAVVAAPAPQRAHGPGVCVVVGDDHAALAVRPEVLGGVEAEAAEVAQAADPPSAVLGPVRLRRVLDDRQPVPPGHGQQRVEVGRMAVEMHGDHRLGPRGDRFGRPVHVHRAGAGIDVHEHRGGPGVADGRDGGDEREGHRYHFVAGSGPDREQGEMQGAGPRVDGDAVRGPAVGGELALEGRHFRSEHELSAREHARRRFVDLRADRRVLAPEVHQGHFGHGARGAGRHASGSPSARAAKHQMTSRLRLQ